MTPLLYLAIKSLYWSGGRTLKKILWCDSDAIRPYFIAAGKALHYGNLRRQLADSLEDRPFVPLPKALQKNICFAFGSAEKHYKYRSAVMHAYPYGKFPVFTGYNHMQYQIENPEGLGLHAFVAGRTGYAAAAAEPEAAAAVKGRRGRIAFFD